MKNAIKIAFGIAVATVGIAACTATPDAKQNAVPTTPDPISATPSSAPSSSVPPSSAASTVVTTVTSPPQPESLVKIDNRLGYGALKLHMTAEEAVAAGVQNLRWGPNGDSDCAGAENVAISKKYGVERITLPEGARTSRGIGVGSTVADVKKAYPNATEYRMGFSVKLNDTGSYSFTTFGYADTDKIVAIKLMANQTDCAFAAL